MHISYATISSLTISDDKVFAASKNGILVLEKSDNSLTTYSKLNGLSGTGISCISYNEAAQVLVIGYDDGNIDLIKNNAVTNFDRLKNSLAVTGSKKINHISMNGSYAYLATDYGIVVFDLISVAVKETWRDLASNGSKLKIYQSAFQGDSIFLATEKGVLSASLTVNLLDYNNWKRYIKDAFNGPVPFIVATSDKMYTAINSNGLYYYENGVWTVENFLENVNFSALNQAGADLLIAENNSLWKVDREHNIAKISNEFITQPLVAATDLAGDVWVGDSNEGLVSNVSGFFSRYLPNGPINTSAMRLEFSDNALYSLPGGYTSSLLPSGNANGFDRFVDGQWQNISTTAKDITDISFSSADNYFISSFGFGIEEWNGTALVKRYDDSNSPLVNTNPPGSFVTVPTIDHSTEGLWIANYGAVNSLHLLKSDDTWQSFSFGSISASRYPIDLLVDYNNYVWMSLNPLQGGGILVFDHATDRTKYITDQAGSGALPGKSVYALALDKNGVIWIGTDSGVAYFNTSNSIFNVTPDAIKPILENRYLLRGEKVTCIKVDGANRKWVGTEKGAWLFSASGEDYIYNFTEANSPLLSDKILDIEVNPNTGEVFFATDKGIVSYRGDATQSTASFQSIKIFPNPITNNFNGTLSISGLATSASVKITDVSGKLCWQTQANGGTATWNGYDYNGHHVTTGVYIVYATSPDGKESVVGKIAVVE